MKRFVEKTGFWILLGLFLTFFSSIPYFLLGEQSIITYHDQLDGEILTYILRGRHFLENLSCYPELMNGIPSNGIVTPAPAFVLLYALFEPFHAFIISLNIVKFVAYSSMFLLLSTMTKRRYISFFCSVVFMMLPFYPVYGLCIPAQPLVWYAFKQVPQAKKKVPYLLLVAIYAACSSLALVGYAILIVAGIYCIIQFFKKDYKRALASSLLVCCMGIVYALLNYELVLQLLGFTNEFVSHKTELNHTALAYTDSISHILLTGAPYTESNQRWMLPLFVMTLLPMIAFRHHKDLVCKASKLLYLLIGQFMIALFYAFYHGNMMVGYINSTTGIFHTFNFDRFSWLMTVIWYVALAVALDLMVDEIAQINAAVLIAPALTAIYCFLLLIAALYINDLRFNLSKLLKPDYYMLTWKQFFAEDIFKQIDDDLNQDKSTYRVISLGITPSAAAYNGFYCLDAYSNNYSLAYKHEFREIIAAELEKDSYIQNYFDNWGNRCYTFSQEYGTYTNIEKKWNGGYHDLDLNLEKLKEMGCKYIFAATWILDAEKKGLKMLNGHAYESEGSWYNIYVYEIQ